MRLPLTSLQSTSSADTNVRSQRTSSWHADETVSSDGECRGRCYSEVRFFSKHIDSGIDERSLNLASLPNTTRWASMLPQIVAAGGALPERYAGVAHILAMRPRHDNRPMFSGSVLNSLDDQSMAQVAVRQSLLQSKVTPTLAVTESTIPSNGAAANTTALRMLEGHSAIRYTPEWRAKRSKRSKVSARREVGRSRSRAHCSRRSRLPRMPQARRTGRRSPTGRDLRQKRSRQNRVE